MSTRTANLAGWGLIASIAAICFVLNQLRAQYLYFNWFVIFAIAASAVMVCALWFLERRTVSNETDPNETTT
tara:strand:+ start:667 stop:882 length:216 start_codon:yes stop_codon:yes gene_type:complete